MSLKDIREQIATILSTVEGMGIVHQYQRWSATWEKFLDLFKDTDGRINGCIISRRETPTIRDNMPTIERRHVFLFRFVYALKDAEASELEFQNIVERIQDAFDSQYLLGNTVINSGPVQVNLVEIRLFGGVLCHYAELTLEAVERVEYI